MRWRKPVWNRTWPTHWQPSALGKTVKVGINYGAEELNVSRQVVIKMLVRQGLDQHYLARRARQSNLKLNQADIPNKPNVSRQNISSILSSRRRGSFVPSSISFRRRTPSRLASTVVNG